MCITRTIRLRHELLCSFTNNYWVDLYSLKCFIHELLERYLWCILIHDLMGWQVYRVACFYEEYITTRVKQVRWETVGEGIDGVGVPPAAFTSRLAKLVSFWRARRTGHPHRYWITWSLTTSSAAALLFVLITVWRPQNSFFLDCARSFPSLSHRYAATPFPLFRSNQHVSACKHHIQGYEIPQQEKYKQYLFLLHSQRCNQFT